MSNTYSNAFPCLTCARLESAGSQEDRACRASGTLPQACNRLWRPTPLAAGQAAPAAVPKPAGPVQAAQAPSSSFPAASSHADFPLVPAAHNMLLWPGEGLAT